MNQISIRFKAVEKCLLFWFLVTECHWIAFLRRLCLINIHSHFIHIIISKGVFCIFFAVGTFQWYNWHAICQYSKLYVCFRYPISNRIVVRPFSMYFINSKGIATGKPQALIKTTNAFRMITTDFLLPVHCKAHSNRV